jgi:hypothetical protein
MPNTCIRNLLQKKEKEGKGKQEEIKNKKGQKRITRKRKCRKNRKEEASTPALLTFRDSEIKISQRTNNIGYKNIHFGGKAMKKRPKRDFSCFPLPLGARVQRCTRPDGQPCTHSTCGSQGTQTWSIKLCTHTYTYTYTYERTPHRLLGSMCTTKHAVSPKRDRYSTHPGQRMYALVFFCFSFLLACLLRRAR